MIHTYSGYENKVKTNLEHRIQTMDAKDLIFQVVIPTEDEIEIRDGQRRTVARKIFPGYVLTQMIELKEDDIESSRAWFVVRNTPGVTGFVGSGTRPVPLEPPEVKRILRQMRVEAPKVKVGFIVGQNVRIVDGPFQDFVGHGRRHQPGEGQGQGAGVVLRARDAGRAGLPAGRAAVAAVGLPAGAGTK